MLIVVFFVVYGLLIGSFCNVVIHRLRTGEDIVLQRSHCPKCKNEIAWRDNVPVIGYILLRGKCRYCKKPISIQYPLVELLVGILFGFIGYFYVTGVIELLTVAILYALAMASLVVILVYDAKYMEIPMTVMWIAIALLFAANVVMDLYGGAVRVDLWDSVTVTHGISTVVAFCFFFGLSYVSDETWMGYGDAFVAIAIGLLLGPMATFIALLIAFCVGAIYGVTLMAMHRKTMKSEVPFGPFLIMGMIVTFLLVGFFPDLGMLFI